MKSSVSGKNLSLIKSLYYSEGKGVPEIAQELGVGTNAVYRFMRSHDLKRRSFSEMNRIRFEKKKPSFNLRVLRSVSNNELKVAGVFLYWAEGYKRGHLIDFTNSDVEMVKIFMAFLRKVCGVNESKLRLKLFCYPNQNTELLERFWSKVAGVPRAQFNKPYIRKVFKKKHENRLPKGLIHIIYSDKKLLLQVNDWIREYIDKWVGTEVVKRGAL